MPQIATHPGIVEKIESPEKSSTGKVSVRIEVMSACATCHSHSSCTFAEKKDKVVEIETTDWSRYTIGDKVTVIIDESNGLAAVFWVYVLPAILLLTVFITLYITVGELFSAIAAVATVGIYWLIIYLCRPKFQKKFTFQLRKSA